MPDSKRQVARSAAIIRRALSWALELEDPGAFETEGIVLTPWRKGYYSSADASDEFDASTQVTVKVQFA